VNAAPCSDSLKTFKNFNKNISFFRILDRDGDGEITVDEFVQGPIL